MASEHIEPAFAHIVGKHFSLLEEAKKTGVDYEIEYACRNWWMAMEAMTTIIMSLNGLDGKFSHASIALMNEKRHVSKLIEEEIGYNPYLSDPKKDGWKVSWT